MFNSLEEILKPIIMANNQFDGHVGVGNKSSKQYRYISNDPQHWMDYLSEAIKETLEIYQKQKINE